MTAQAREKLIYKGKEHWMASEPLSSYLKTKREIKFAICSTACWRGYRGTWEIIDDQLYLVELKGKIKGDVTVGVSYVFPGRDYAFASWFTGSIRIPHGRMLEYTHAGFFSIFEKDLFMQFKNGVLTNQHEIDNVKEYEDGLLKREQEEKDRILHKDANSKKIKMQNRIFSIVSVIAFASICVGLFRYYQWGTMLARITSIWMFIESFIVFGSMICCAIFESKKNIDTEKFIILAAINFVILFLIALSLCIYYSIQMNTIWGNLIAGASSLGVLLFVVLVIRASYLRIKDNNRDKITVITEVEKKADNKSSIFLQGL